MVHERKGLDRAHGYRRVRHYRGGGVDTVEESELILSESRLLPDPGSLVSQTKTTPRANHFGTRARQLIPNPC